MKRRLIATLVVAGVSSAETAWACQVAGNLVSNCGFTSDTTSWSAGAIGTLGFSGSDGSNTGPGSGELALGMAGGGSFQGVITQCITGDVPTGVYNAGGWARVTTGTSAFCAVSVFGYSGNNCTTGVTSCSGSFTSVGSGWTQVSSVINCSMDSSVVSVFIQMACSVASFSAPQTVHVDDFFFGVGLVPVELQKLSIE